MEGGGWGAHGANAPPQTGVGRRRGRWKVQMATGNYMSAAELLGYCADLQDLHCHCGPAAPGLQPVSCTARTSGFAALPRMCEDAARVPDTVLFCVGLFSLPRGRRRRRNWYAILLTNPYRVTIGKRDLLKGKEVIGVRGRDRQDAHLPPAGLRRRSGEASPRGPPRAGAPGHAADPRAGAADRGRGEPLRPRHRHALGVDLRRSPQAGPDLQYSYGVNCIVACPARLKVFLEGG